MNSLIIRSSATPKITDKQLQVEEACRRICHIKAKVIFDRSFYFLKILIMKCFVIEASSGQKIIRKVIPLVR